MRCWDSFSRMTFETAPILMSAGLFWLLGLVWYSPRWLGIVWANEYGMARDSVQPNLALRVFFLGASLVLAAGFDYLRQWVGADSSGEIALLGCLIWVCFVVPTVSHAIFVPGGSVKLWAIDAGFLLAGYATTALTFILFEQIGHVRAG